MEELHEEIIKENKEILTKEILIQSDRCCFPNGELELILYDEGIYNDHWMPVPVEPEWLVKVMFRPLKLKILTVGRISANSQIVIGTSDFRKIQEYCGSQSLIYSCFQLSKSTTVFPVFRNTFVSTNAFIETRDSRYW